jgi:hypothetical protein
MEVQVNYLAVFLAAVSSMVIGSIWYAKPVFGRTWMKLANIKERDTMTKSDVLTMVATFGLSLLTAYVLAHVVFLSHHFFGHPYLQDAVSTAFWVWLGFVVTRILTHNLFEQKPTALNMLATGNEFMTIMVMGLIIGWLAP